MDPIENGYFSMVMSVYQRVSRFLLIIGYCRSVGIWNISEGTSVWPFDAAVSFFGAFWAKGIHLHARCEVLRTGAFTKIYIPSKMLHVRVFFAKTQLLNLKLPEVR